MHPDMRERLDPLVRRPDNADHHQTAAALDRRPRELHREIAAAAQDGERPA